MQLAPIVLFVYNRPSHTRQVIEALRHNPLAKKSELFIYSDAPKDQRAQEDIKEVREYIHSITGFKNITIIERERNFGLADNIIDGVTSIVNQYGKVIVLEDDIVVSPVFLNYMNDALKYYKREEKVWSISAYCLPTDYSKVGDCFFTRELNCWGWATWKDRWLHYNKDTHWAINNFSKQEIKYLNLNSIHNYWGQLLQNHEKQINTWFIFFYLSSIKNHALALSPTLSYVTQIGFDDSGMHCKNYQDLLLNIPRNKINTNAKPIYPQQIIENTTAISITKKFYLKAKILLLIINLKRKIIDYVVSH